MSIDSEVNCTGKYENNKEKTRRQDVDKQETDEEDVKKRTTSNWSIDIHTNM